MSEIEKKNKTKKMGCPSRLLRWFWLWLCGGSSAAASLDIVLYYDRLPLKIAALVLAMAQRQVFCRGLCFGIGVDELSALFGISVDES